MIELIDVDAGYGKAIKLFSIGCTIPTGSIVSVIGPNGSGKSTLLKTILGMLSTHKGQVLIDGRDVSLYRKDQLARIIAFLPQNRNIPIITVERMILHGRFPYLAYPRRYLERDYELVEKALDNYGLLELRHRQLQDLSGGERQRVYLAMAGVQDSEYYLFDEPTTYLDIAHQFEFLDQIRQLKKRGKTCVVVLHDLESALKIADFILVLEEGKLVFQGDHKKLIEQRILEQVFHIQVRCVEDEIGGQWYYIISPIDFSFVEDYNHMVKKTSNKLKM